MYWLFSATKYHSPTVLFDSNYYSSEKKGRVFPSRPLFIFTSKTSVRHVKSNSADPSNHSVQTPVVFSWTNAEGSHVRIIPRLRMSVRAFRLHIRPFSNFRPLSWTSRGMWCWTCTVRRVVKNSKYNWNKYTVINIVKTETNISYLY